MPIPREVRDLSHLRKPVNATVYRHEGVVDVRCSMLPGALYLVQRTEHGSVSYADPTLEDIAGYNGKKVRITLLIEELKDD